MGIFSRFEDKMEDTVEGAASRMSKAPISPVQIAKKAERQMRRETMVGAGKEYAPTLYTVLVNADDDARLFGYYPTLAGETETYLKAKATQEGLVMDGNPLVRFIVDEGLRHGKFDVIAETVAAPIIAQLRQEEMERYGIAQRSGAPAGKDRQQRPAQQDARGQRKSGRGGTAIPAGAPAGAPAREPLPYVPEEEIDRSIDYGEYTFDSRDFDDYQREQQERGYNDNYSDNYADNYNNEFADYREYEEYGADYEADSQPLDYNNGYAEERRQVRPANTIAYAGEAPRGGKSGSPDHRKVRARLINLNHNRPYDLATATVTLGRDSKNTIPVNDINASRMHAELRLDPQGHWIITDLDSTNGTLVNGMKVASQPLRLGDVITIGKTDFEFALAR